MLYVFNERQGIWRGKHCHCFFKAKTLVRFSHFFSLAKVVSRKELKNYQSNSILPDLITHASYEIFGEVKEFRTAVPRRYLDTTHRI